VRLPIADLRLVDVDVIDLSTCLALIFIVNFHDLDFLVAVDYQFFLVLGHKIGSNAKGADLFW
jgi:hypothetical protein